MKKMVIFLSLLLLSACGNTASNEVEPQEAASPTATAQPTAGTSSPAPTDGNDSSHIGAHHEKAESEAAAAAAVMRALKEKDMSTLAHFVHPDKGVLFSPYVHIDKVTAQVFPADKLPSLTDPTVYNWGSFDGSGEPIKLTFAEYYDKFVYSQDFLEAESVGVNEIKGKGNSIPNIAERFPGSFIMDYYFSGFDEQYAGMDWESLILVLEEKDGAWYVSAIVHSGWTI